MKSGGNYDEKTTAKAKQITESCIKNNFKNIQSIDLEEPFQSEMGALTIEGTVNNKAGFHVTLNDKLKILSIGTNEGFPERKEECKED
ncbi:hypothetical protein [Virgibacillus sp. Bac330]|uniref:hypothetical protein n=1 Tax=Virgibacillus sp. Bac330 TaxID=2419841 RepID=UPI0013CE5799|nr:hypothetical protein [Virgibacillus sp. Bac330]